MMLSPGLTTLKGVAAAGSSTIGGRQCDKFTAVGRMGDDSWEAWLEKNDVPLLCRLVYRNVDGPTQTNEFRWKPNPVFSQDTFVFSPPEGSTKVDVGSLLAPRQSLSRPSHRKSASGCPLGVRLRYRANAFVAVSTSGQAWRACPDKAGKRLRFFMGPPVSDRSGARRLQCILTLRSPPS